MMCDLAQESTVRRRWSGLILFVLILSLGTAASRAQTPIGPEFHANDFGRHPQGAMSATLNKAGELFILWEEYTFNGTDFRGQWFSSSGMPLGRNRLIHATESLTSLSYSPLVALGAHGGALVFWTEDHIGYFALVGGELLPDGSWILPPRPIIVLDNVEVRFVSPLPRGGYAIAGQTLQWRSNQIRTFLAYIDDNLNLLRGPSFVSPVRHESQEVEGLAVSPSGELMVSWTELGSSITILAQLFSPAGHPLVNAFKVPENLSTSQYGSAATALGKEGYVVIWEQDDFDSGSTNLWMRALKPNGTPRGDAVRLNPVVRFRYGEQVASDAAGNFFVVWQAGAGEPPNGDSDIWGRLYHPDGSPYGPEVRLNEYSLSDQVNPQVLASPNGTFVVVWQSSDRYLGDQGIFGRIFAVPPSGR